MNFIEGYIEGRTEMKDEEEEEVSSYCMSFRKKEGFMNW